MDITSNLPVRRRRIGNNLHAYAGGIDDHAPADFHYRAHTRRINVKATFEGQLLPDAKFTLRFVGNRGHSYGDNEPLKVARLHRFDEPFDDAHPWRDSLDLQTDARGSVISVWVLSSDVINKPTLQAILKVVEAPKEPVVLGGVGCDFAAVLNYRRFGIPDEDGDGGWKFDQLLLFESRGNVTPAKFWIKIQKNPHVPVDLQLLEDDGATPRRPDDWDNWLGVGNHRLTVRIDQIVLLDGTVVEPERFADYITLLTAEAGTPTEEVETQSRSDGSNQVWLKSGESIAQCKSVELVAYELTQSLE